MAEREPVINDFQIMIATVNGSGSQTANTVILRSLFRMGIPVNGKNIFPSNIQGLPTWFTIRLSKNGYIARLEDYHILVAMNEQTIADDLANLSSGGVCLYPEEWAINRSRDDVIYYPLPVKALVDASEAPVTLKSYVANMVYVGALATLLNISLDEIEFSLNFHFGGKAKPVNLNMSIVRTAYEWTQDHLAKADPYLVEPMDRTEGMLLLDGNSAAAMGAVFGGVSVVAWYPITPSTSLVDSTREYLQHLRTDKETGKATYAVIQAEDEIGAIGMVIGAGWAGARAMTATSGPGISLMTEFTGLAYYAEVPAVIFNVQRMGPSTGLPTRTSQGDIISTYFLGHGDTKHVMLLAGSLEEAFEFGWRAFDLAERLQTPVFVMLDLDLGMNLWMGKVFEYPDEPMDRGKVVTAEDIERAGKFARYEDVDGDGIGYRSLPGTDHPLSAWFARGTGHNEKAVYSERPEDWLANMHRLNVKFDTARELVPQPEVNLANGAKIGIIAYGTSDACVIEGRDRLKEQGVETSYLRLRALPLNDVTRDFIAAHDRIYVVEANGDGQMAKILHMEYPELAGRVHSLAYSDGLPLTARWLTTSLLEQER
ncbi:MAG TPA: 2-oxoacid:acceptor oxidoreductase subunit alpha [Aggregatilinea sp.]|uniref:2-oxoacid:acceptor oxidoreductase subunit alpha n=1 Tax=Aggregatilinea sp. TaxID=2806333 RepID=UPI002C258864|nr:2-oxoacid:acceptor oxidoreductase subunit alpha [Aggregatilinea sp.]HML23077.1 2-oxoacid:acceptor oxidoreductase subunit alpha [Aggregatilinea sp.]